MKTITKPHPKPPAVEAAAVELVRLLVAVQRQAEDLEPALERHAAACGDPLCDRCHLLAVLAGVVISANREAGEVNSCLKPGNMISLTSIPSYRRRR